MTGDLLAAHWCHPGHNRGIPTVAPRGEADLVVGTRLPAPMVTLGRLGPSSNRQRTLPRHLVAGVGSEPGRSSLLRKVIGEGTDQYPGEAPAQTSPPPLPPLVES